MSRHEQVPIVRRQIRALREVARFANNRANNDGNADEFGFVLTSMMNASLALELGLKIFYMSYFFEKKTGHDLKRLWNDLPDQIRGDISASYAASSFNYPDVKAYGYVSSTSAPATPGLVPTSNYASVEEIIDTCRYRFIDTRYFFERISSEWVIIENSVYYLLSVSEVIDVVYDKYIELGGWKL